jgi:hypothetical protein
VLPFEGSTCSTASLRSNRFEFIGWRHLHELQDANGDVVRLKGFIIDHPSGVLRISLIDCGDPSHRLATSTTTVSVTAREGIPRLLLAYLRLLVVPAKVDLTSHGPMALSTNRRKCQSFEIGAKNFS